MDFPIRGLFLQTSDRFIRQIAFQILQHEIQNGDAADYIAEHDTHQRHHHHSLKLDALNEPDKNPDAQDRGDKSENNLTPNRTIRLQSN